AIDCKGGYSAVTKEKSLNEKGNGNGQGRCPWPQYDSRDADADGMCRGAARHRQVEHHDNEAKGRKNRDQWHQSGVEQSFDAFGGVIPAWNGNCIADSTCGRAEVTIR